MGRAGGADLTITAASINCSAAVASALAKIVIYDSDANGRPNALVLESGTADMSTTGIKTVTISTTLMARKTYWLGIRHSSTATISTWATNATPDINGTAASTTIKKVMRRTLAFATAAPSTWGYTSTETTAGAGVAAAAIWLRV